MHSTRDFHYEDHAGFWRSPHFWTFDPISSYGPDRTVPETCKQLGDNIRYLRTIRRWSQEALGLETGLNRTLVGAIERAEINTTLGTAEKIARAFGLTVAELLSMRRPDLADISTKRPGI
jgi:DNA-binding XRE family transcriptional regulator